MMTIQSGEYSRTILIVDDAYSERLCYQQYLMRSTKYRYQFITSGIGEETSFLYQRYRPDVVLLDYSLPASDPSAIIKQLRDLNAGRHVPVIVTLEESKRADAQSKRAMAAGAHYSLLKERITADRLRAIVEKTIFSAEDSVVTKIESINKANRGNAE